MAWAAAVGAVGAVLETKHRPKPQLPQSRHTRCKMLQNPTLIWLLVALQTLCGAYFLWEIFAAIFGLETVVLRWQQREFVQIGASLGLVLGSVLGVRLALMAKRDMQRANSALRLTSGEFTGVVQDYFKGLGLTPAETDVAWFILKGMSVSAIADLRETRVGTIKAQCTAIYKKAGVSGKSQLLSQLVEDLLL